jgi:NAD(P)-dependent dehydrogenase (short-subunit alcohol dehydrogenase family)
MAEQDEDDSALTVGDFHNIAQKQIMNAVYATLSEAKMGWNLVEPFLEAGRGVCAGDFAENARIALHSMQAEGETWVEAEEAFLGISVADRVSGEEWMAETYWLSDIATAGADREDVRAAIAALERTIAKLNVWLENGGPAAAEPPESDAGA